MTEQEFMDLIDTLEPATREALRYLLEKVKRK